MLLGKSEKNKSIVLGVLPQLWEKLLKSHTYRVKKNPTFFKHGWFAKFKLNVSKSVGLEFAYLWGFT